MDCVSATKNREKNCGSQSWRRLELRISTRRKRNFRDTGHDPAMSEGALAQRHFVCRSMKIGENTFDVIFVTWGFVQTNNYYDTKPHHGSCRPRPFGHCLPPRKRNCTSSRSMTQHSCATTSSRKKFLDVKRELATVQFCAIVLRAMNDANINVMMKWRGILPPLSNNNQS